MSRRNILTPQPFPWSSWCHPLSCHFHFAFGSWHCTNKYSFSGNLCSVVWANRRGPEDILPSCGDVSGSAGWSTQELPVALIYLSLWAWQWDTAPMLALVSMVGFSLLFRLTHMWSFLPSIASLGQMQCSNCVHVQLTCNCWSCGFGNGSVCALFSTGISWRTVESRCSSSLFGRFLSHPPFLPLLTILLKAFLDGFPHFSWAQQGQRPSKQSLTRAWCKGTWTLRNDVKD